MASTLVIGGGISGLATAFRLRAAALARGETPAITVLEAGARWGGVIQSSVHDGCVLEHGPDSLIRTKPAGLRLIADLGLDGEVQGTSPEARRSLIARGDRLLPVPEGLYLLAPGRMLPFLASPLLSWPGKLRMALDLLLPRRAPDAPEESLAAFVRRRLGREALARIAQPLVGGIYTADPELLSLRATMPQFLAMEQEHRSLILAMRARSRAAAGAELAAASGPRYGLFVTLRGGLQRLTDALAAQLGGLDLRLGARATALERRAHGGFTATLADGTALAADRVVIAGPAHRAAPLLAPFATELAAELAAIPYAGVATVNLAFAPEQIARLPRAAGFVVPAVEGRTIIACTFADQKYAGRVPAGTVLLRAFAGGALRPEVLALDDATLVARLLADLRDLLGVRGEPRFATVHRWPRAMAQYVLGHEARVRAIRAAEAAIPGLALVGNGYEGVGIPDLAAQAEDAADRLGTPDRKS